MFAYCKNNPVNYADPSGNAAIVTCTGEINLFIRDLSGFFGAGGGGGGGYASAAAADAVTSSQGNVERKLYYQRFGDNNTAKIVDSYKITSPFEMYMYISQHRGDEIKGSTVGVVVEWAVHNVAYYTGDVLTSCGFEGLGKSLMDSGRDLDVGGTIYQDDHGALSAAMWCTYIIVAPVHAGMDLIVELFE